MIVYVMLKNLAYVVHVNGVGIMKVESMVFGRVLIIHAPSKRIDSKRNKSVDLLYCRYIKGLT